MNRMQMLIVLENYKLNNSIDPSMTGIVLHDLNIQNVV